jgi:hypothetical protein
LLFEGDALFEQPQGFLLGIPGRVCAAGRLSGRLESIKQPHNFLVCASA